MKQSFPYLQLWNSGDRLIYAIVGVLFFLGAIVTIVYSIWDFTTAMQSSQWQAPVIGKAIIQLVSDLLLVLIIMEVFGTVLDYLKTGASSLQPFLFIGIISATRGILAVGAKLSVGGERLEASEFNFAMIELGVNAAVILALGITIKLLCKLFPRVANKE